MDSRFLPHVTTRRMKVLYYELEDNAWCCVRPSGTEPKIKFYYGVKGSDMADSEKKLEAIKADMLNGQ